MMVEAWVAIRQLASSARPMDAAQSACSPSWQGKYSGYVLKMYVPEDLRQYGRCNDYGRWSGTSYKGREVPPGSFWVYKYPYWYVWRGRGARLRHRRKITEISY